MILEEVPGVLKVVPVVLEMDPRVLEKLQCSLVLKTLNS